MSYCFHFVGNTAFGIYFRLDHSKGQRAHHGMNDELRVATLLGTPHLLTQPRYSAVRLLEKDKNGILLIENRSLPLLDFNRFSCRRRARNNIGVK